MNKGQDKKVYYKMYKKGRFWVFAGITLAMLNVNTVVSHADEAADSSASDTESSSTTSVASQLTDQKVVLSSSNQASKDTDSATSTNTGAVTDTTKADTTSQEDSSATGDTSSAATDSSVTSDSSTGDTSNADTNGTTTEGTKAATTSSTTEQTSGTTDSNSSATDTTKTDTQASGTTDSATTDTTNTNNSNEVKVASDNLTDSLDTVTTPATNADATNTDTNTTGDNTAINNGTTTTPATDNSAVDNVTTPATTGDTVAVAENEQLTDDLVTVQDAQAKVQDAVAAVAATTPKSRMGTLRSATITGTYGTMDWDFDPDTGILSLARNGADGTEVYYNPDNQWSYSGWQDQVKTVNVLNKFSAGTSMSGMFKSLSNVTSFTGLGLIDTSKVTWMDSVFQGDTSVVSLDLSGWKTGSATTMEGMFYGSMWSTSNLQSLNLSGWDTSNVTSMYDMFTNNVHLSTIDGLTGFNTAKVTVMADMFANTGLSKLDLTSFDSSSLTDTVNSSGINGASGMFSGMTQLKTITFGPDFTLSNTAQFQDLFSGDSQLEELDLSHINMQLAIPDPAYMDPSDPGWLDYMSTYPRNSSMLSGTTSLKKLTLGPNNNLAVIGIASSNALLPEITKTADYTGYWVDENNKSGKTYTSAELMALYSDPAADVPLVTYVWQVADKTTITTTPVSIYTGRDWNWSQSITALTDSEGIPVDDIAALYAANPDAVTVTSTDADNPLDLNKAGVYNVTFTYNGKTATADVTVLADQANIDLKPSEIYAGDTWTASDNFNGATDNDGTVITLDKLTVTPSVDTTAEGAQTITYSFTDSTGQTVSKTVTVTVLKNQTSVAAKDATLYTGGTWTAADTFDGATDKAGNPVDLADVTVTGEPDLSKAGTYTVTYSYNGQTATATIKVSDNQNDLQATDSKLVINKANGQASWQAADNFISATNSDGSVLSLADLTTTDNLDLTKAGSYTVTYQFTDKNGNVYSKDVTVEVVDSKADLDAKGSTMVAGPNNVAWQAGDNFVSAHDAYGNDLKLSDVTVSGTVNTQKAGKYAVMYSYTDAGGNQQLQVITVEVTDTKATVAVKDSSVQAGKNTTWNPADNFVSATDENGKVVDFSAVKVSGTVDTTKAGVYPVTYTYTDGVGNVITQTANVEVTASKASLEAKDTSLVAGPNTTWTAADNFVSATDTDGQTVDVKDVKVSGTVDTTKAGDYPVTYTYTDAAGNEFTQTVTVTVVASKASLKVKDTTLTAGKNTTWTAADNFVSATDANGDALKLSDVKVSGTVDTTKAGDYPVTYTYTDAAGNVSSQTVTVKVVASQAAIKTQATTVIAGPNAKWTAADSFVSATDANGNALKLADLTVTGTVDTTKAGTYPVTYSYTDSQGNVVTSVVTITVVASQASLQAKDVSLTVGSTWNAAAGFVSATDVNGKALSLSDVKVSGTVDTTKAGTYTITYSYTDAAGNVFSQATTVTVTAATNPDNNNNGNTDNNGGNTNNNGNTGNNGNGDNLNPGEPTTPTKPAEKPSTPTEAGKVTSQDDDIKVTTSDDLITPDAGMSAKTESNAEMTKGTKTTDTKANVTPATAQINGSVNAPVATKHATELPQTNEHAATAEVIGLTLLAVTSLFGLSRFGRNRRHE